MLLAPHHRGLAAAARSGARPAMLSVLTATAAALRLDRRPPATRHSTLLAVGKSRSSYDTSSYNEARKQVAVQPKRPVLLAAAAAAARSLRFAGGARLPGWRTRGILYRRS
jgi:uncharacterized protein GlcG (DUF336 family)